MLVLSRKCQESVVMMEASDFEPTLKVTVLEINGTSVRLGFAAAGNLVIHRWEVWERIRNGLPGGPARGPPAPVA